MAHLSYRGEGSGLTRRRFARAAPLCLLLAALLSTSPAAAGQSTQSFDAQADRFTQRLIEALNAFREDQGLSRLSADPALTRAAQRHTLYMVESDHLAHEGPDGVTLEQRVSEAGYRYSRISENLAAGPATPQAVLQAWLESQPHRVNLMAQEPRHVGAAYHPGPITLRAGAARHIWTLILGAPGQGYLIAPPRPLPDRAALPDRGAAPPL